MLSKGVHNISKTIYAISIDFYFHLKVEDKFLLWKEHALWHGTN